MKKTTIGLLLLAVLFMAAAGSAQMRRGDAAIYMRDGRVIYDHPTGIVTSNLVVQTPNNGEFYLRDVWLINYEEDSWNYPAEREQMDAGQHAIFLRNGNVAIGQIVNFLSENEAGRNRPYGYKLRANGQTTLFMPGSIARIYLGKAVPPAYRNQNNNQVDNQNLGDNPVVGSFTTIGNSRPVELQLLANGTARWTDLNGGRVMTGTWRFNRGDTSIVVLRMSTGAAMIEMTFGRDGNDLVGLNYDKKVYGQLRFRK